MNQWARSKYVSTSKEAISCLGSNDLSSERVALDDRIKDRLVCGATFNPAPLVGDLSREALMLLSCCLPPGMASDAEVLGVAALWNSNASMDISI